MGPQPPVPPDTGRALPSNMVGEKFMVTTPIKPTGQADLKGIALNCTTTVLPELAVRRSVFVMVIDPVALVVGFDCPAASGKTARIEHAKMTEMI